MTDKKLLEEDGQFYTELLRAYFDSTNDAIFVLCDEMKFLVCNKMTERWLGATEQQLTQHKKRIPITRLLGENFDTTKFSKSFQDALNGQSASLEIIIRPDKGDERWVEINLTKVDIANGDMVIAVARDISERKKHLSTINYQAHYDTLTDLPNRTTFIKYLHGMHSDLVLFILDLDRFKIINESLGQQVGDSILREVAQRLQRNTDETAGELSARFGGDMFAIVIPDLELSLAPAVAQSIRQQILQPVTLEAGKVSLDCAIGIASSAEHGSDINELIKLAEVAMYKAKSERLGINIYTSDTLLSSADNLQLVNDLRDALEAGDIRPFYQPIVNMHDEVIHVEALARWKHPVQGYIPPDKFIYIAEESGLINRLTSRILQTSITECSEIVNKHVIEGLSINLSSYCLSNTALPAEIEACLKKNQVPANAITLELTESSAMSTTSVSQNTIQDLHELGLAFSIDDFGTGYSSLAKLKQMTVKELKIDKSFVMDISNNEGDVAISYASIQMAHGLGINVVAEGIEDEATWLKLREMGCDYGQGFWIAKPMPYDNLLTWLQHRQTTSD